jgi:two-component system, NarL family, nitrate/nitrite response regulator NarL
MSCRFFTETTQTKPVIKRSYRRVGTLAEIGASRKFEVALRCVRVVIAAREPVVLCGLTSMLEAANDFKVVGSCQDGPKCIETIRDQFPALALLDFSLSGQSGLQVLSAIKAEQLCTRAVFLSRPFEGPDTEIAISMGAFGVIPREAAPHLVVRFLRQVASGRRLPRLIWRPESRSGSESGGRGDLENLPTTLTERERQIIHLVSEGRSNKNIGRQLNLTEGTIKVHLHRIYQKLAIHNRTALAALAGRKSQWWWPGHAAAPAESQRPVHLHDLQPNVDEEETV